MKTESIILSSGIQVNRTRKNGVTIITTGEIPKVDYIKHMWTAVMVSLFSLSVFGSIGITIKVISEIANDSLVKLLFISPLLLFIGTLMTLSVKLFIQAIQERYEK